MKSYVVYYYDHGTLDSRLVVGGTRKAIRKWATIGGRILSRIREAKPEDKDYYSEARTLRFS